jgi:hypothetical protein
VREIRFFTIRGASANARLPVRFASSRFAVQVRMQGSCHGCGRPTIEMATMVHSVADDTGPSIRSNTANRKWMRGRQGV